MCDAPRLAPAKSLGIGQVDLKEFIDVSKSAALNNDDGTFFASILEGVGELRSDEDVDEQLLLYVEFTGKVKVTRISCVSHS
jgi:hypothetical protein